MTLSETITTDEHYRTIKPGSVHDGEPIPVSSTHPTITLVTDDGTPVAILSGHLVLHGVLQVSAIISENIRKYPIAFMRKLRAIIAYYFTHYPLRRMQMSVRSDRKDLYKWASALGFKCEGIMRKYGPNGLDYLLFARTE